MTLGLVKVASAWHSGPLGSREPVGGTARRLQEARHDVGGTARRLQEALRRRAAGVPARSGEKPRGGGGGEAAFWEERHHFHNRLRRAAGGRVLRCDRESRSLSSSG
ncbi:unnamed protein product [Lampetra fluviatilis]